MVAPLEMHGFRFLTALVRPPKSSLCVSCQGVRELACLGTHDLHGAMVPHDFLSSDPPHWGPTKGTALFRVWCAQKLGLNGCENLNRDA
jgi:hypothetical protein